MASTISPANAGWVSVGIDHDTAAFAVQTIRRWWQEIGRARYPEATRLDDHRRRRRQQRLARAPVETRAATPGQRDSASPSRSITCRPGTSKWNKIEHRLFSFITQNWRAKPLVSYQRHRRSDRRPPPPRPASRCAANSTPIPIPRASPSPTPKWPPSISNAPNFTANGTIRSAPPTAQIERLIPDKR